MRTGRNRILAISGYETTQHMVQPKLDTWIPLMDLRTQIQRRPQAHTHILHSKHYGPTQSRTRPTQTQQNMVKTLRLYDPYNLDYQERTPD